MASASSGNKTEKATPKKRRDERKKGNIFQSNDVVSTISILLVFVALRLAIPFMFRYFQNFFDLRISEISSVTSLDISSALGFTTQAWAAILLLSAPAMAAAVLAAVLSTGVQTGFKFSFEKIKFKFSNISPLQGVKRLFSIRAVVETLKAVLKTVLIGYIVYLEIAGICNSCVAMLNTGVLASTTALLNDIFFMVLKMSVVFIGIAAADYLYQWWDYERSLRMTKQELKEEFKETEGNPEIKGRIRQLQRKFANRRMMQQVPKADVVVRNPTHFAVALRYNIEKDNAPVVLAKGQDAVALKIIEIAQRNNIPMKEDRPLARALYAAAELNREVPPEFYKALAEIMAWVYRMKKEGD